MRRFISKVLKISFILFGVVLVVFLVLIHNFFQLKTDEEIISEFTELGKEINISTHQFKEYSYRSYSMQKELDSTLPNLLFIHGSPGTGMDFKRYLLDEELNSKANLLAYDRIGYNSNNLGEILPISEEVEFLEEFTESLDASKTILVGYSYGGPISLGVRKKFKEIILCAPAVSSEVEPMFWFLNFYKWKATRWVMPDMLKAAAIEKLGHQNDLKQLESNWAENPSGIYVIHGDKDWIVPYENSLFIQKQFPEERFNLVTLPEASHDLIWSRYEAVKSELLKVVEDKY